LVSEHLKELKQGIGDWQELLKWFPENKYVDVEGLCKIVDLEEVKENDYSLTPGRYVGYSIQIDDDFDYKARMQEIHSELAVLNTEANDLMQQILNTGL
jgi:type I restriction enzyme M protein